MGRPRGSEFAVDLGLNINHRGASLFGWWSHEGYIVRLISATAYHLRLHETLSAVLARSPLIQATATAVDTMTLRIISPNPEKYGPTSHLARGLSQWDQTAEYTIIGVWPEIAATDQEPTHAGAAHVGEGDLGVSS
jgi:hypothetical protein